MRNRVPSYLRTHRKRAGFTQREVALLLGLRGGQTVARYERLARTPSLRTALACQVLFDSAPDALFPGLYDEVESLTLRRIEALAGHLEQRRSGLAAERKHERLREAIARARMRQDTL